MSLTFLSGLTENLPEAYVALFFDSLDMDGLKAAIKRLLGILPSPNSGKSWFFKTSSATDHPLFPLGKSIYIFFKKLEDVSATRIHSKFDDEILRQIEAKFKPYIANIEFIDSEKRLKRVTDRKPFFLT